MTIEELKKYKKILILGYGIEGRATHEFLKKFIPDSEIGIADQKDPVKSLRSHGASDSNSYLDKQADYDLVIKSPGIPKRLVTKKYTTATNIFFANVDRKIIGVTGTKGKSTTVSLIYSILKKGGLNVRLIGNIGVPMLGELMNAVSEDVIYVCELSSYQLDDIKYSPYISVILNLFPEHMDYHGSFELYKEAKKNIVKNASEGDYFVYNPAYEELARFTESTRAKQIPFIDTLPFSDEIIQLKGGHNKLNVKAAVTVAGLMNISDEVVKEAISEFKPLPHRLEFVGNFKGIDFYDDAISTTPESTIAALDSIENVETIFLGGKDRGYDFGALVARIMNSQIKNIVLFPNSGSKIKEELLKFKNQKSKIKILETRDMESAVEFAYKNTSKGMGVLLSCASPSYSLWKNFEEKGDEFKKWVKEFVR